MDDEPIELMILFFVWKILPFWNINKIITRNNKLQLYINLIIRLKFVSMIINKS